MPPSTSTTPRPHHGAKSVHYEDSSSSPLSCLPRAPPYNTRMLGFGCPDVSVPVDYLGPRIVPEFTPAVVIPSELSIRLRSDLDPSDPATQLPSYDLSELDLSCPAAIKLACQTWKTPLRRSRMQDLNLSRCRLNDDSAAILSRFLLQAPSAAQGLHLRSLNLSENGMWSLGFSRIVSALAKNTHVSVERIEWNDGHVGALVAALVAEKNHAEKDAEEKEEEGTQQALAPERNISSSPSPPSPTTGSFTFPILSSPSGSSSALLQQFALHSSLAAAQYTPLLSMLSSSHCKLHTLHLSQNGLGDLFVSYLCEGLRHTSSLIDLVLDQNELTDRGARLISEALGGRLLEEEAAKAADLAAKAAAALAAEAALLAEKEAAELAANEEKNGGTKGAAANKKANVAAAKQSPNASSAQQANSKSKGKGEKGGVEEEEIAEPEPKEQPLPLFSSPRSVVNSTLRSLSLRSNRIGVLGIKHLDSALRSERSSVFFCDISLQRLPPLATDQLLHESWVRTASAQAERNRGRKSKECRVALALGMHERVGAKSSLGTLVQGAKIYAAAVENNNINPHLPLLSSSLPLTHVTRNQQQLSDERSLSRSSANGAPSIPSLTFSDAWTRTNDESAHATPAPHALVIQRALQQVWEFVGYQQ